MKPYSVIHLQTAYGTACGRGISNFSFEKKKSSTNPEETTCKLCMNTLVYSERLKIAIGKRRK